MPLRLIAADAAGQLGVGLQAGQHLLGLGGVGGHLLVVGQLRALALLHQLQVVQVRADDVDLLVQHLLQLLAALDVLAELEQLAGDAALGQVAGGGLELLAELDLLPLEAPMSS